MTVRVATSADLEGWVALRARLWDSLSAAGHREEAAEMLAKPAGSFVAFVDVGEGGRFRAFAEAALRHDYVNGCSTSPVAFLEGIYVCPEDRGTGLGATLLRAVEAWAVERGCSELASDTEPENTGSRAFHGALGFEETEQVVFFRKGLNGG